MRGFSFTPKRTKEYEQRVFEAAFDAMVGWEEENGDWPRDNAHGFKMRIAVFRETRRGDLDNFCKSISDPLNKLVYDDDRRVVEIEASMYLDRTHPRTVVEVEALDSEREVA